MIVMGDTCGLYFKLIMNINDDSSVFNKFGASLTDDTRYIIYDHNMFNTGHCIINDFEEHN